MHELVVSFYFYHSGSCVEYAATFFAAELVNVVWFFHHCLPCFVADIVPYFGFIFGCFVYCLFGIVLVYLLEISWLVSCFLSV